MNVHYLIAAITMILGVTGSVFAGGGGSLIASNRGDGKSAFSTWEPLVEQSDANARPRVYASENNVSSKTLYIAQTAREPLTGVSRVYNGEPETIIKLKGKSKIYTIKSVKQADAARVLYLIGSKIGKTTNHPINDNDKFRSIEISDRPGDTTYDGVTTLKANGDVVLSSSITNNGFVATYTASLEGQDELLLVGTFHGGNSCDSSRQIIVARSGDHKYNISPEFGRCSPTIYDDNGTTYFVYAPDEYNVLTIVSLASIPIDSDVTDKSAKTITDDEILEDALKFSRERNRYIKEQATVNKIEAVKGVDWARTMMRSVMIQSSMTEDQFSRSVNLQRFKFENQVSDLFVRYIQGELTIEQVSKQERVLGMEARLAGVVDLDEEIIYGFVKNKLMLKGGGGKS